MSARPENPRHQLIAHPTSPPVPVREISVSATRDARHLILEYRLTGNLDALLLPSRREAARADELWRHTCFEAFFSRAASTEYFEYNFSPSGEWAAYQFGGYRTSMRQHEPAATPSFISHGGPGTFELAATVDIGWLPRDGAMRLGVTAVIEDRAGVLSYWALKHLAEKPDFHHPDSFVIDL